MRRLLTAVIAGLVGCGSPGAHAQIAGLLGKSLGLPESGVAGGAYQANNQIRTYISTGPYDAVDLYALAITKAAEMTAAKSFPRFGVTKANCSTMVMNGSPVAKSCYVIAIMVKDGEQAQPRGKRQVQYYNVSEVQAGLIARPTQ